LVGHGGQHSARFEQGKELTAGAPGVGERGERGMGSRSDVLAWLKKDRKCRKLWIPR
jgi:hypothetical protein